MLVVSQDDVVAGPVLAHQVRLQHQRLELVVGHDVLEVGDLADQRVGLRVARPRLLEVGADAAPQRGRLADVDDLGLGVAIQVDARSVGKASELVVECRATHVFIVARTRARVEAWVAWPGLSAAPHRRVLPPPGRSAAAYATCWRRRARMRSRSSAACSKSSRRAASFICASSSAVRRSRSAWEALSFLVVASYCSG